jgi:hypothetical protein
VLAAFLRLFDGFVGIELILQRGHVLLSIQPFEAPR